MDESGELQDLPTIAEWNRFVDELQGASEELLRLLTHARIADERSENIVRSIIGIKRYPIICAIARIEDAWREVKLA